MNEHVWDELELEYSPLKRVGNLAAAILRRCTRRAEERLGADAAKRGWLAAVLWCFARLVPPQAAPVVLGAMAQYFSTQLSGREAQRLAQAARILKWRGSESDKSSEAVGAGPG